MHVMFDASLYRQRPDETMFTYWMSYSPMAPLFGVKWRFAGLDGSFTKPVFKPRTMARDTAPEPVSAPVKAPEPVIAPVVDTVVEAMPEPVAQPEMTPAVEPEAAVAPAKATDDLTLIKGIGPKLCAQLQQSGITSFAQIAALTEREVDEFEAAHSVMPGRVERDNWIGQAKALTSV